MARFSTVARGIEIAFFVLLQRYMVYIIFIGHISLYPVAFLGGDHHFIGVGVAFCLFQRIRGREYLQHLLVHLPHAHYSVLLIVADVRVLKKSAL